MIVRLRPTSLAALLVLAVPAATLAQNAKSLKGATLPPLAPTSVNAIATSGSVAPLAAVATPADRAGGRRHRAQVHCEAGQLTVRADNSSLNGILQQISRCTGMKITGGVLDQRVFGNYGPAASGTVLATLLDGTGSNILLRETAADQPAELILTPRTEGPTPPSPNATPDDDPDDLGVATAPTAATATANSSTPAATGVAPSTGYNARQAANVGSGAAPGVVSGPVSIPQPINNVNGSPSNTSPTAANYPTTHSVPLDSLPTPSTTPSTTGIVDAPNPPPAGSDTAALLNGRTTNQPGNIVITDKPTTPAANGSGQSQNAAPAATSPAGADANSNAGTALTPQQIFEELQKLRQQQSQSPQGQTPAPSTQPQ